MIMKVGGMIWGQQIRGAVSLRFNKNALKLIAMMDAQHFIRIHEKPLCHTLQMGELYGMQIEAQKNLQKKEKKMGGWGRAEAKTNENEIGVLRGHILGFVLLWCL